MNKFRLRFRAIAATAGLALMLLGGFGAGAQAAPTTYALSGTLDWTNLDHDSISGTVTYDTVGHVASLNVTIAKISGSGGGQETGTWNGAGIYDGANGPTVLFSGAGPANLYLNFAVDLNSVPATDTLAAAAWICGVGCRLDTTSINVSVTSAPEPASLAVLGSGLGLLSLVRRLRFHRAGAFLTARPVAGRA
jgi:hypothetical protein